MVVQKRFAESANRHTINVGKMPNFTKSRSRKVRKMRPIFTIERPAWSGRDPHSTVLSRKKRSICHSTIDAIRVPPLDGTMHLAWWAPSQPSGCDRAPAIR